MNVITWRKRIKPAWAMICLVFAVPLFLFQPYTALAVPQDPTPGGSLPGITKGYFFESEEVIVASNKYFQGGVRFTSVGAANLPGEDIELFKGPVIDGSKGACRWVMIYTDDGYQLSGTPVQNTGGGIAGDIADATCIQFASKEADRTAPFTVEVDESDKNESGEVPCAVQSGAFGWILCPFLRLGNAAVNFMLDNVIAPLLEFRPLDENQAGLKSVWEAMRNLANVFFVLIFLVIIFANTLSIHLDAYTVKKSLPKLAVAVILVQFSYLIAGFMVDVGNVLGQGIGGLIGEAVQSGGVSHGGNPPAIMSGLGLGLGLFIGLSAVPVIGIGTIMIFLLSTLIGVLGTVLVLVIRHLFLAIMIVISPLAFAAWVLPNTEDYFKFWLKNTIRTILMYPMIMILFSIAELLSVTAQNTSAPGPQALFTQILAGAFPMIAFFLVPATFSAAGAAMGKFTGMAIGKSGTFRQNLKNSQLARDAAQKRKDNLSQLAAGQGVGFAGRNFMGGSGKTAGFGKAVGTAVGRAAHLDPQGTRSLANFNRAVAHSGKSFEDAGINGNRRAMELITADETDFKAALNSGGVDGTLAKQVQRFRGDPSAFAAATVSFSKMGGDVDKIRQSVVSTLGNNPIADQVWRNVAAENRESRPDLMFTTLGGSVDRENLTAFAAGKNQGDHAKFADKAWAQILASPTHAQKISTNSLTAVLSGRGANVSDKAALPIIQELQRRADELQNYDPQGAQDIRKAIINRTGELPNFIP